MVQFTIDMPRKCAGVPIRYHVLCEICGHQAVTTQITVGRREPKFVCSNCGDAEPIVERIPR